MILYARLPVACALALLASASPAAAVSFIEGQLHTLHRGETCVFSFTIEPCAGAGGNCCLYACGSGEWTAWTGNEVWPEVGGGGAAAGGPTQTLRAPA